MSGNKILEFQGYVKASLEAIKVDIVDIKTNLMTHTTSCDKRIEDIEKEQSKIKGVWLGITGIIGLVGALIGKWLK